MSIRRVFTTAAVLVFSAGLFAACGGGDSSKSSDSSNTTAGSTGGETTGGSGTKVTVTAKDISFDETTLTAKAGEATTFTIKNEGKIDHNLTIEKLNVKQDVKAGKSASQTVTPEAGTYEYHCEYHPTQMKGELTVS